MFTKMAKNEYLTHSASETEAIGASLAEAIKKSGKTRAFIAMTGEMGVGKTAFVRGFSSVYGIRNVKSPTYTMVNEYRGEARIFHFDMYRIESDDDLISIGYDDYVMSDGFCIAEWCENIENEIPEDAVRVNIERLPEDENGRRITIIDNLSF